MTRFLPIRLIALALPAAAHAQAIEPGQWDVTVTVKTLEMPGAPPGIAQAMAGKPRTISNCVTAEQAASGPRDLLKSAPNCSFTSYSMAGGKISAEMRCAQSGGTMTTKTSGSYTPTSFTTTSSATLTGRMTMKMTSVTSGRRTGACTTRPAR